MLKRHKKSHPIEESWIVMTSSAPRPIYNKLIEINEVLPDRYVIQLYIPYVTFNTYHFRDKTIIQKL